MPLPVPKSWKRFVKTFAKQLPPLKALAEHRRALLGERETLTEGRDALMRERDALLHERETLRRERDELRARLGPDPSYDHDGLRVWSKNPSFLRDPAFVRAYQRGMNSGHRIGRLAGSHADIHIEWRVHIICAAAWHARQLPGDFVECGVNTGIFSLALCDFIDFNSTGKTFYLFDTYNGIPEEQMSEGERPRRLLHNNAMYDECYATACRNFAAFPKARLIRGKVPDSLHQADIDRVCYLSLDMNIAAPERAALEHFWDKLVPGAPVILDDYGWIDYAEQKETMDDFAARKALSIFNLPTGQGLLLKPPTEKPTSKGSSM